MPSPKELAEVRARIRELITEFTQQDMPSDELGERLHRLGVQNGRPVLNMLVTMAVNGMRQLQRTVPGAQLGGIARHLQDSVSVHGEPYSSMVYGLTEAMRLGVQRAPEGAQQAINEVWRSWGPDAVEIGVTIVVILYARPSLACELPCHQPSRRTARPRRRHERYAPWLGVVLAMSHAAKTTWGIVAAESDRQPTTGGRMDR